MEEINKEDQTKGETNNEDQTKENASTENQTKDGSNNRDQINPDLNTNEQIKPDSNEDDQNKSDSFQFPSFDSPAQENNAISKSNTLSINIEEEEEDKFEFPQNESPNFSFSEFPPIDGSNQQIDAFQFSFDNFHPNQQNDQSAFTFDANENVNSKKEEEQLYQKFVSLISNQCFEYKGKPLKELFKQEDSTESVDSAYNLLIQAYK